MIRHFDFKTGRAFHVWCNFASQPDCKVLCRYLDQIDDVEVHCRGKVYLLKEVVNGAVLVKSTGLLVAGRTMTAEATLFVDPILIALLMLFVEQYLVKLCLVSRPDIARSLAKLERKMIFEDCCRKPRKRPRGYLLRWKSQLAGCSLP